jgi:hypothetical protein
MRCNHIPIKTTRQMLGNGGDYETVPVTVCRKCKTLLSVDTTPDHSDDGEDD